VRAQTTAGTFAGLLELDGGLQVISADNAYGKSLAVKSVAWCLGVEPIFGIYNDDPTCFPEAVLARLENPGSAYAQVLSSECSILLVHEDSRKLGLTRAIKGDSSFVRVEEHDAAGVVRKSRLSARHLTMQDQTAGLQRFLFGWLGWPRVEVPTFKGEPSEVYIENLMPLFYIDQTEGWTDLQAQQIGRYSQLEIKEIAVEFLLGATDAIKARVRERQSIQRRQALRDSAKSIAEHVTAMIERRGWAVEWSGNGSIDDILNRWVRRKLRQALKDDANVDLYATITALNERAQQLRQSLTTSAIDRHNTSIPVEVSQKAIELKQRRHALNESVSTLRLQKEQADELISSLEHRIRSASDLLRLKETGVGRLDHVECPTCHRDLDPATFALTEQSADSIRTHIEALKRDREMMVSNTRSIESELRSARFSMQDLDVEVRDAERMLMHVTAAVGTERQQVAKIAGDLATVERDTDRAREASAEVDELQVEIDRWVADAHAATGMQVGLTDLRDRRQAFLDALGRYLVELGHSEVRQGAESLLRFDEQYIPYFDERRLRSLGSASDQSRLIAAYALALAASTSGAGGLHPGLVILDEPLQQNPDPDHRDRFMQFLSRQLARSAGFQTVIFTSLTTEEVARLRKQGVNVRTPEGKKLLQLVPEAPTEPVPPPPTKAGKLT
jgi:hypothetical protein